MYRKEVVLDSETGMWAMWLDDVLVGHARTKAEGEKTLAELILELMTADYFREAA